jgi:hypothetical protein
VFLGEIAQDLRERRGLGRVGRERGFFGGRSRSLRRLGRDEDE